MAWPSPVELYSLPYYWGQLTLEEAKEILSAEPSGSYLLRDSIHGSIAISRYCKSAGLIEREITQCKCICQNPRFGTVSSICEFVQRFGSVN